MSENREICEMVRLVDLPYRPDIPDQDDDAWRDPYCLLKHDGQKVPGRFLWGHEHDGYRMIHFILPGGFYGGIPVHREGTPRPDIQSPVWTWDGNEDRPTLAPSIWMHGCWHGFVRAGRMESC